MKRLVLLLGAPLALLPAPAPAQQQTINVGGAANDGTGDSLRTAFTKANTNFSTLFAALAGKAASVHTHVIADVTGLQAALDGKQPLSSNLTALSAYSGAGTGPGTLATGNDPRITGAAQKAANLSDLASIPTARTNLGLGGAALLNVGTAPGTVAAGDDGRITGATQNTAAAITGGTINGTSIGGTTPAPGAFTTLSATTPIAQASGGTGYPGVSAALDGLFSSTQGAILYRGPAAWLALPPGASGQVLASGGTGANPSWVTASASGMTTPPVRQTAYTGPRNTDGTPSLLPSTTSGTLTLTAQNVSSTVPFGITAAQGSGTTPNVSYTYTANPSWTLSASATNYLFGNASTGATVAYTLQPIAQYGGTISTANGQFTFDYAAMIGYLGNGTAAVVTPLVPVGEAVTSSTAVTSTITYAYNGYWDSGWTATLPANGSVTTKQHNLGVQPGVRRFIAENTTADIGYSVGEQIASDSGLAVYNGSYDQPLVLSTTRLAVAATLITGNGFAATNKGNTASNAFLTPANWRWKEVMSRGY